MRELAVATYNVHRCVGRDRRFCPERIALVLRRLDADVIALQEVETADEGVDGLPSFFARALGMNYAFEPTFRRRGRLYGNLVLSTLPITSVVPIDLSLFGHEPRGALDVTLAGGCLRVLATHLGLARSLRRWQSALLRTHLGDNDVPTVILGDFNEWRRRDVHTRFGVHPGELPNTFPARRPLWALDRIYTRRLTWVWLGAVDDELARIASDHVPLLARLRMPAEVRSVARPRSSRRVG